MGKLTCFVMVGFMALHIAEILLILAIATPEWSLASENGTVANETAKHSYNKGLWEICIENDNCTKLNQTMQDPWFKAVQGVDVTGVGLGVLALLITYVMLLSERYKKSGTAAIFNSFVQFLAAMSVLTALIIFGVKAKEDDTSEDFPEDYVVKFAWSYFVDVVGVILMWLSAFMTVAGAKHFAARREGYEDI